MIKKIIALICCVAISICLFASCKKDGGENDIALENENLASMDFSFTDNDLDASYNKISAEKIDVSETHSVTEGGTYILSGETDELFTVEVSKDEKVKLVLNNVSITNSTGPAILIKSAKKVFITLEEKTENTLSDGSYYSLTEDGSSVDAAIFSKEKLTINGSGSLTVKGNYKHAIVSKDDVVVADGNLDITSKGVGILGEDSVKFASPTVEIVAGTDAIRGDNKDDAGAGFVYIQNGTFSLTAQNDTIQSSSVIRISDGTINAYSGSDLEYNPESETSQKGLRADSDIIIEKGSLKIASIDDAINSKTSVSISGGEISLTSGDDAIHADGKITISDGTVIIPKSNEGMEAGEIYISGGNIDISSEDDGINIANTDSILEISGGYTHIAANGDGIDSNGQISILGGVTLISGPEKPGNGSFDYATRATVSGGVLIALGSGGMDQNFTESQNQGAILYSFKQAKKASTPFALCDEDDKVIVSFTPDKAYSSALITAPEIKENGSYKIVTDMTVIDADINGFVHNGKGKGGTVEETIKMTSSLYGEGNMPAGGFPQGKPDGNFRPEDMPSDFNPENMPERPEDGPGNTPDFRGEIPENFENMPTPPEGFRPENAPK